MSDPMPRPLPPMPVGPMNPGRVPGRPTDARAEDYVAGGFFQNVYDEIATSWWTTIGAEIMESNGQPVDPDFDPLAPGIIKGKENYAYYLREAKNRAHFDAMYDRLKTYEERKARLAEEGGLASALTGGLIDPLNVLPVGIGAKGVGFLAGAARGALIVGGTTAAATAVQSTVVPVSNEEIAMSGLVAGALGGLIGGVVDGVGAVRPRIPRLAEAIEADARRLDEAIESGRLADPLGDGPSTWGYEARPSTGREGVKPALGIQRIVESMSDYGRLLSSGVRSFEDLGHALAGELDTVMARNVGEAGEETQQSAFLAAGRWHGRAGEMLNSLQNAYAKYAGGGDKQLKLAGVNLPVTGMRVKQFFTGRGPQGKMTLDQFHREVARAHFMDRIEHPVPEVVEAARQVRKLYDEMREAGIKAGALPSREGAEKQRLMYEARIRERQQMLDDGAVGALAARLNDDIAFLNQRLGRLERFAGRQAGPQTARVSAATPGATRGPGAAANDNVPPNVRDVASGHQVDVEIGPITRTREDGSPVYAFYDRANGKLYLDVDALRAQWEQRPWQTPRREGVNPLPDEFPTPDDWVEFVTRHELIHTRVRQGANQSLADYENAVNDLALAELRERRAAPRAEPDAPRTVTADNDPPDWAGPENEPNYLNRMWSLDKVLADEAGPQRLRQILTDWFRENPIGRDPDEIDALIQSVRSRTPERAAIARQLRAVQATRGLTVRQQAFLTELESRAGQRFLSDAEVRFVQDLARQFNRSQLLRDEEMIAGRVDKAIAGILKEAEHGEYQGAGDAFGNEVFIGRSLDIPNEKVWDFIEDDVSVLIRTYAHRFGQGIEYARMFGERDAELAIRDAALQAAREGKTPAQIAKMEAQARNVRDLVLGDVWRRHPANLTRQSVQGLLSWTTLSMMGSTVITSLTELARPLAVQGIRRNVEFALNAMTDTDQFRKIGAQVRRETGQGLETALGMTMSKFSDHSGVLGGGQTMIGRTVTAATNPIINFAGGPYWLMNLLGPFTDTLKNYAGVMASHYLIKDAAAIAAGTADEKALLNWKAYGLSVADARRITAMPVEKDRSLWFANVGAWTDDDLARKFMAAVNAEQRRTSPTGGVAHLPNAAKGLIGRGDSQREIALMRIPFQMMNYAFAATTKVMLSALQGRDQNAMAGVLGMTGIAYATMYFVTPQSVWDKMSITDKIERAVEKAGYFGIFNTIHSRIEGASQGEVGIRPLMGLPPRYKAADEWSRVGAIGPAASEATNAARIFFDSSLSDRESARMARRVLPLTDLFYLKFLFDELEPARR